MTVQTIPAIEDMTSNQLADLLDAVQIERFRRRNESPPESHIKTLRERELARKNISDNFEEIDRLEAVEGIRRGMADVEAGRGRPAEEFFDEMFRKFNIPRRRK